MNERVSSILVKGLNYDFEFKENTLNDEDRSIETDLYNINIFGNDHVIAMGGLLKHPENDELLYVNAYLIYGDKVVTKIGIYELLEDDEVKTKSITHRNLDFSKLKLLVDNYYYEQPHILDSFIHRMDVSPKKKVLNTKENVANEANEEDEKTGENAEENAEEEAEEEAEEKAEEAEELLDVLKHKCSEWSKQPPRSEYTSLRLRNIFVLYHKTITNQYMTNSEQKKLVRGGIKQSIVSWFPGDTKEFDPTRVEKLTDQSITPDILILMEYFLNVKCILLDESSPDSSITHFSILGALKGAEALKDVPKANENILFKEHNPETILYMTKVDDHYTFVGLYSIRSLNEVQIKHLKDAFETSDHEFVFDSQFTTLKQVVS